MTAIVRTSEERLWGRTVRTAAGLIVRFEPGSDADDGTAGDREPRRPKPAPPSLAAAADVVESTGRRQ